MTNRRTGLRAALLCGVFALAGIDAPAFAQDYDLLPLLDVDRNGRPQWQFSSPVGGYVRFWIERVQAPAAVQPVGDPSRARSYTREARDPLSRLLWGRNQSRILQAKLVVQRSNVVTQSVTLAAASHDSNSREGESWRSELGERRFLTPYFRVDQGSTAVIEVSLSASRETDSAVTRNILSIVQAGARLAAPTGPLVTALNSDRLNQASNFVDTAISRLFREKVVETTQSDFPAERWILPSYRRPPALAEGGAQPPREIGSAIAAIRAHFPMGSHVWTEGGLRGLGEWRVYATEPIVSIFSTVSLEPASPRIDDDPAVRRCREIRTGKNGGGEGEGANLDAQDLQACIAFSGLVPTRVLGLPVGENVTLGQSLRGDAGIAAAVQRFQGDAATERAAAREICNLVAERADALGLNAYDSAAAVWAFAWNGGLDPKLASGIWSEDCAAARLATRLRLSGVPSSATQSPGAPQTAPQTAPPTIAPEGMAPQVGTPAPQP